MVNVDTHIVLHGLEGRLTAAEQAILQDEAWGISAIVLWEIAWLARAGRISRDLDDRELSRRLDQLTIWPIDEQVARTLKRLDYRADPAAEIIGATSLRWNVPLLTRDARILASKVVPLALP